MASRPPRLEVGVIVKALQFQIAHLNLTLPTDKEYGDNLWKVRQLEEQVEALNYRPTTADIAGWGGRWLGTVRSWIQSNFRNGSDVTWGSHETLHSTSVMTPARLEQLAALIAREAVCEHMGVRSYQVPKSLQG